MEEMNEDKHIRKTESLFWLVCAVVFLALAGAMVAVCHFGQASNH